MKKGVQMTTNTLVVLAIAIIILLSLVSLYVGIVPGAGTALGSEADLRIQCNKYINAGGCSDDTIHAISDCTDCSSHDDDTGCIYVKCTTAYNAIGSVDEDAVHAACCG